MTSRAGIASAALVVALIGTALIGAGCSGTLTSSDVDRAFVAAEWLADELGGEAPAGPTAGESGPSAAPSHPLVPRVERATVVRVVDGDTARFLTQDGIEEPVRFIGIDTPESTQRKEPWGAEASEYTRSLLPVGTEVYLEFDAEARDRYNRLLAYVWLERPQGSHSAEVRFKMLNAQIVLAGYATPLTIQPNSRYADLFSRFTEEARSRQIGMWNPEALSVYERMRGQ